MTAPAITRIAAAVNSPPELLPVVGSCPPGPGTPAAGAVVDVGVVPGVAAGVVVGVCGVGVEVVGVVGVGVGVVVVGVGVVVVVGGSTPAAATWTTAPSVAPPLSATM